MATFKEYKQALISRFHVAKEEDVTGMLMNLTPAQTRQLCLLKLNGISKSDELILRIFFETKESESLRKSIEYCNIDKFKPIISFLRGERDSENSTRVEVAAILIDHENRPYKKFSGVVVAAKEEERSDVVLKVNNWNASNIEMPKKKPKWLFVTLFIIGLFGVGYTTKNIFLPEKECMQWQKDRYELINCNSTTVNLFSESSIIPIDHSAKMLKKIEISDSTVFFKGIKPIVWYSKVNGVPECFDNSGYHPVTGKPLKPITKYIVNKYFQNK